MAEDRALKWAIEIETPHIGRRLLEILPGALSWTTLIGLSLLAFIVPFWIAIFIIMYDVYIFIRGLYMTVHLVYAYLKLKRMKSIDWPERARQVSQNVSAYYQQISQSLKQDKLSKRQRWQHKQLKSNLADILSKNITVKSWEEVHHIILLSTYDESLIVLRTSLEALRLSDFPHNRLHVAVGFEERKGDSAHQKAQALRREYQGVFGSFITTMHPDGLPGEKRVKSANATWAMKKIEDIVLQQGIKVDDVLVSNFDSDTVVEPSYFSYLTYTFITHSDRYHVSYQPLPMYNNNLWDAPAFSRIIATGSTFWQMIESTRPERLVTFSSHSMTLRALKDVGYWHTDIISEDSRIFWQCLIHYDGHYSTEPMYTSVSMDAALAGSWWQTFKNQYKQKRRWGWGIENFPYFTLEFLRNKKMPGLIKYTYIFRTLEGHYAWATAPIIVAGLGWLPIFFGGAEFHSTVLSYSLPFVARTIMSVAMLGLLVSTTLSLLLLPAKPQRHSRWKYVPMSLQWILFPIIATILSALPALDAETRLMLGRDLEFNVMQKERKSD